MDTSLLAIGAPFVLLAFGALVLSVRLSPLRFLLALVSGWGTVGSIYWLVVQAQSWPVLWYAFLVWLLAFPLCAIFLAIVAERTHASTIPAILSGASTGLVMLGVYVFSQGWIAIIIGTFITLLGLLPAGLAYGLVSPTGIAKKARDAGVVAIAGTFGLFGLALLDSSDIETKGIGPILCLGTVGVLMLAFPELRPGHPAA